MTAADAAAAPIAAAAVAAAAAAPDAAPDAAELLAALVRIPSINPRDAAPSPAASGEGPLADHVAGWLRRHGVASRLETVADGRPNVIASVPGASEETLLLETHLDTVEVPGMADPFGGRVREGRLEGRGSCDAKASLAVFMLVLARLAAADAPPPVTVQLAAVADEEHAYRGVLHYLEGPHPSRVTGAIVGEPTGLRLGVAHKGCARFTVRVTGRSGHSSRPAEALNAIDLAARLVAAIENGPVGDRVHPLLGAGSRTVTRIAGGEGPNVVPGRCEFDIDRRIVPGESPEAVRRALQHELTEALGATEGSVEVGEPFTVDPPLDTDSRSAIAAAASTALARAGLPADPVGLPFGTDASKLARAGIPTVVLGPGDIAAAHSADESVDLAEVVAAVEVMLDVVRKFGTRVPGAGTAGAGERRAGERGAGERGAGA